MLAAPLIAGNDLRSMPAAVAQVLTNRDVIAVNQDSLGVQGFKYASRDSVEIWFKPLAAGDWAVTFLNRGATPRSVSFDWAREAVADSLSKRDAQLASTRYQLRNLWTKQAAGTTARPLAATVPAKDVLMLRLHRA
jgi:alpha-galactosidase